MCEFEVLNGDAVDASSELERRIIIGDIDPRNYPTAAIAPRRPTRSEPILARLMVSFTRPDRCQRPTDPFAGIVGIGQREMLGITHPMPSCIELIVTPKLIAFVPQCLP